MARKAEAAKIDTTQSNTESPLTPMTHESKKPQLDSKYRMIIVAAQRSKQLQRGARPRVELDHELHKPTRIALMEVKQGAVDFEIIDKK